MLDKTIDSALLNLRKKLIRGDGEGLYHVEALLRLRGIDAPRVLPAKRDDVAMQGYMRLWLLDALKQQPMRLAELVAIVCHKQPDVAFDRVNRRTSNVLWKMRCEGLVANERRVWRITQPAANTPSSYG